MPKIAVMEDDEIAGEEFVKWIKQGISNAEVLRFDTLDSCKAALKAHVFDVIVLDIKMGMIQHAGIELMQRIDHLSPVPPVLVVSGLQPEHYRGVTRALGAWDFLQKPCADHDLIAEVSSMLKVASDRRTVASGDLRIDPLKKNTLQWKGHRVNVTQTGLRIVHMLVEGNGQAVPYAQLIEACRTGKTDNNIRKHIGAIRSAFKEVDPDFNCIHVAPQLGFLWTPK